MQHGTDEEKNILFALIDGRYELSRSTILTTSHAVSALEEMIGERCLDWLREGSGRMVSFSCDCPDQLVDQAGRDIQAQGERLAVKIVCDKKKAAGTRLLLF